MPSSTTSGSTGLHLGLVGAGRIGVMHARNIAATPGVARLTIADADAEHARRVAGEVGAGTAGSVEELLGSGIDGLVVATSTASHPALIRAGVEAGLPVLCEKPVASDVPSSLPVLQYLAATGGVVQIGHQRRFDRGYQEARRAYRAGELGWIHSLRAVTCDAAPPPVAFIATSGGLFRDVSVHDFDILRWLTGREIVEVYARGSNNGDPAIGAAGDVDTALAVCTLDDGTIATVTASRYNGAGHDVRLEIQGSQASLMVGLEDATPLRSAEPGVTFPPGPPHATFAERFAQAYRDEIVAFTEVVRGERENPCTPGDAVAASVVADAAQESLERGTPVRVPTVADAGASASASIEQETGRR
jgi:myo-inositol 2-dehydrogenase / D-chiro-inositol 1-dehydrogenase